LLKVENIKVSNIKGALHGMRNAMASWDNADSIFSDIDESLIELGNNDKQLAQKLVKSGSDHRKFIRQIFFCADITAPDYWWKEMDTYKVATVANSTSTMHKLTSRHLVIDDFSYDHIGQIEYQLLNYLNGLIDDYKNAIAIGDKEQSYMIWRKLIQSLPMSFNYTRTWSADYETLRSIHPARRHHKLNEWHTFCDMSESLPLAKELITINPWYTDRIKELEEENAQLKLKGWN
jgi:hypothetical protein